MSRQFALLAVVSWGCGASRPPDGVKDVDVRQYETNSAGSDWIYEAHVDATPSSDKVKVHLAVTRHKSCTKAQHSVVHRIVTKAGEVRDMGNVDVVLDSEEVSCQAGPAAAVGVAVGNVTGTTDTAGAADLEVTPSDLMATGDDALLIVDNTNLGSAELKTLRTKLKQEHEVQQFNEITQQEVKSGTCTAARRRTVEEIETNAQQVLAQLSFGTSKKYKVQSHTIFVATPKGQDVPMAKYSSGSFQVVAMGIGVVSIEVAADGKSVATNGGGTSNNWGDLPGLLKAQIFANKKDAYGVAFNADPSHQYVVKLKGEGCNVVLVVEVD